MKVKISESETYEINLKEEVSAVEFREIVNRLSKIAETFSIVEIKKSEKVSPKNERGRHSHYSFVKDRDEAVRLFKVYYLGSKADRLEYANAIDGDWKSIRKRIPFLRDKWDIKPQEIGVTEFPKLHKGRQKPIEHEKRLQAEYLNE